MKILIKKALKSGFSRWQTPIMQGYKMQCCDCGLVHEVEFKVLRRKNMKKTRNGHWESEEMPTDKYRVAIRMRRAKE